MAAKHLVPTFASPSNRFDVEAGKFIDATGKDNHYLGDIIGLGIAGDTAYVSWTDTRGQPRRPLSRVSISDPPLPDNDRYEPNDTPDAAVQIGPNPVFQSFLPQLTLTAGEDDWFKIVPPTGQLAVSAQSSGSLANLELEMRDETGMVVIASGGESVKARVTAGQTYLVRVHSTANAGSSSGDTEYSLRFATITESLGDVVHQITNGTLEVGDQAYYLLQSVVAGSMTAAIAVDGGFEGTAIVEISDLRYPNTVLARSEPGSTPAVVPVLAGQQLLARVVGADETSSGPFSLAFTNLDAFATADRTGLVFPAGSGPSQVASGDVNNDGKADFVVTNGLSNTVSVLLGNGDGTLQAPRQFAVGAFFVELVGGPFIVTFRRDLVLGDFNRDNKLDIAVTNLSSSDVSILLGRGDGTFQPQRRFDATSAPFSITAGDLNNDGILDLAVIDVAFGEIRLAVLLGRGDGTFRNQVLIPTGITADGPSNISSEVKIADVNNDGKADLVYTGSLNGKSYVRLGAGDGVTFGPATQSDGGGPSIFITDLNDDGKLDIVNTTLAANTISFALGNGNGTFGEAQEFFGGTSPVDVQVADLASLNPDGSLGPPDGIPDIISVGSGYPQTVFLGPAEIMIAPGSIVNGALVFGVLDLENGSRTGVRIASASQPLGLDLADVDGDRKTEIAFVDTDGVRLIFNAQPSIPPNNTRRRHETWAPSCILCSRR